MIKLTDIVKEIHSEYPADYEPGHDDLIRKRFKISNDETDSETGTVVSTVEYLPRFEDVRRNVIKYRKEFQPFKYSHNQDIAKIAKDINTNLTKVSQMIFALDQMVKLEQKQKNG